jgi:hypothetical protein
MVTSMVRALDGHAVEWPTRMPLSPFRDQEAELQKEMVSLEQAREFVGLQEEEAPATKQGQNRN